MSVLGVPWSDSGAGASPRSRPGEPSPIRARLGLSLLGLLCPSVASRPLMLPDRSRFSAMPGSAASLSSSSASASKAAASILAFSTALRAARSLRVASRSAKSNSELSFTSDLALIVALRDWAVICRWSVGSRACFSSDARACPRNRRACATTWRLEALDPLPHAALVRCQ